FRTQRRNEVAREPLAYGPNTGRQFLPHLLYVAFSVREPITWKRRANHNEALAEDTLHGVVVLNRIRDRSDQIEMRIVTHRTASPERLGERTVVDVPQIPEDLITVLA